MGKFHVSQVDNDGNPRRGGTIKTIWDFLLMGALFLLAMMAFSERKANEPNQSQKSVDTATVVSKADKFIGKSITLKTNQIQPVNQTAFQLSNKRNFQTKSLLVINASGDRFDLPNNDSTNIHIAGKVRQLSVPVIEREFKLNLQDNAYQKFQNQPAIIAEQIAIVPEPSQVSQQPASFYGKKVAVAGEVEDLHNPTVFDLQEQLAVTGGAVPVILTKAPKTSLNPGQKVEVVGEVIPFVANQIPVHESTTWDKKTKQRLESAYGNKPVIVAETIYQ